MELTGFGEAHCWPDRHLSAIKSHRHAFGGLLEPDIQEAARMARHAAKSTSPYALARCAREPALAGAELFAGEVDGVLGTLLGQASEPDHALPLELQDVVVYEHVLSVAGLYERPVCALVD